VNGGWAVANSLLGHERGEDAATNPILFRAELERIVALARERGRDRDPVIRDRLAWCYTKVETMRFLGYRILTQYLREGELGPEASISKLFWGTWHRDLGNLGVDLLGAQAMIADAAPYDLSREQRLFLFSRADTIYGGSNEIQRNVLGERVLGLPREPA